MAGPLAAQETDKGVRFLNKPVDELLKQARTEDKLVFIDCYSTYCPPCKLMLKKEFPKKEMGDYLNAGFVCAKMNLDSFPELAKKWDVHAFPTYLFMNTDGKILHRMTGYMEADKFIKEAKAGLADDAFRNMERSYLAGNRSRELVVNYVQALEKMRRGQTIRRVALDFLAGGHADLLADTLAYNWFCLYVDDPHAPLFLKVYENRVAFAERYGAKSDRKLRQVWHEYPGRFFAMENGNITGLDHQKLDEYLEFMRRHGEDDRTLLAEMRVSEANFLQDYAKLREAIRPYYVMEEANEGVLMYAFMNLAAHPEKKSDLVQCRRMLRFRMDKLAKTTPITEDLYAGEQPFVPAAFMEYYENLYKDIEKSLAAMTQESCIKGKIAGYRGGEVVFIYLKNGAQQEEAVHVNADGTFEHRFTVELPSKAFLTCVEEQSTVHLFVDEGMKADMDISFRKGKYLDMDVNLPVVKYSGDLADCFHFLEEFVAWNNNAWPFERMDTLSFPQFRETLLEELDLLRYRLMQVEHPVFRAVLKAEIGNNPDERLLRYAWSKPRGDEHFHRWMNSFDHNDSRNLDFAFDYLRWYERENPQAASGNRDISHFENMKKLFSNQQVIDALARAYIQKYLSSPDTRIDEVWQAYCRVSSDTADREKLRAKYEYAARFTPGKPAPDFKMTGTDGKVCRLSDFRGKAVFIDVWATWCSPCCMEIPYMEKLVKHYCKNRKIEFVSISLDKDLKAWKKKLKEDKPEWKQFVCPENFKSTLAKEYGITGIPRFLFIDKAGKIITVDAPRPSSPNIIEYIDRYIK